MRILFYDGLTNFSYDAALMEKRGIGGTESTVVRIAEGLSAAHEIVVAQKARESSYQPHAGLSYVALENPDSFGGAAPDWVIVLRKHRHVAELHQKFPTARFLLWIHNWQRFETVFQRHALVNSQCRIVAVSDAHRNSTSRVINSLTARLLGALRGSAGRIPVLRIHNPVSESLIPDKTAVDPNKLLFFSTANKGLNQVLNTFIEVHRALPSLQLYVAGETQESLRSNPRYDDRILTQPGVVLLGRLPQQDLLHHIRSALCIFYPQSVHPETFGLVFTEANAVGTPVLAHDFGSAREVLGGDTQLVNANDTATIIEKVREWREGNRPTIRLDPKFRESHIIREWRELLEANE